MGVYTDEGISATNTKKRDGFNQMISDALDGKIDLIVTKSVSRFARNTVDSLVNIRKLKEHGVEIFFEKENIYTFGASGELLITIMSSTAQEESRSLSKNVTWGKRKAFSDGKVYLPYKHFLGYDRGENDLPEINEEQAKIVRRIYSLYMQGLSQNHIAKILTNEGIPTPAGKITWVYATVDSILKNEKYKGDAILQKKYTVDFLTKKTKINNGEVPKYFVENSHPAIIDPLEWDLVQAEIYNRSRITSNPRSDVPLSGKIICGACGSTYGPKTWHSNDKYKKVIWQCNKKFNKKVGKCSTPNINEKDIKILFMKALNIFIGDKGKIIEDIKLVKEKIYDANFENQLQKVETERKVVAEIIKEHIQDNAKRDSDVDEYFKVYQELTERYKIVDDKYNELLKEKETKEIKSVELDGLIKELETKPLNVEFDNRLFNLSIRKVVVNSSGIVDFHFKNDEVIKLDVKETLG